MSTLQEIEHAVSQLSPNDLATFRAWFEDFDASIWDRPFEEDVAALRLDTFAEETMRDLREGRCTDLGM